MGKGEQAKGWWAFMGMSGRGMAYAQVQASRTSQQAPAQNELLAMPGLIHAPGVFDLDLLKMEPWTAGRRYTGIVVVRACVFIVRPVVRLDRSER